MSRDQVPDLRDLGALLSIEHGVGVACSGGWRPRTPPPYISIPSPARSYLQQRGGNSNTLGPHREMSPAPHPQVPTIAETMASGIIGLMAHTRSAVRGCLCCRHYEDL